MNHESMEQGSTQAYQIVVSAQQSCELYGLCPGSIGVSYVSVLQRPGGLPSGGDGSGAPYLGHVWEVARRGVQWASTHRPAARLPGHGRELGPRRVETYEPPEHLGLAA